MTPKNRNRPRFRGLFHARSRRTLQGLVLGSEVVAQDGDCASGHLSRDVPRGCSMPVRDNSRGSATLTERTGALACTAGGPGSRNHKGGPFWRTRGGVSNLPLTPTPPAREEHQPTLHPDNYEYRTPVSTSSVLIGSFQNTAPGAP